jgi:hypothetical protein
MVHGFSVAALAMVLESRNEHRYLSFNENACMLGGCGMDSATRCPL